MRMPKRIPPTPSLVIVVRMSSDASKDYYLPTLRAAQLWNEGKLQRVEVYAGGSSYYDPHGHYLSEQVHVR